MHPPTITCPHCRNAAAFDHRFAGQLVSCPFCRGPFQMPAPQAGGDLPEDGLASSPSPSCYHRKRQQSSGAGVILVVVFLLLTITGVGLYLGGVFKGGAKKETVALKPPARTESKVEKLQREYDELKGKLKGLQDQQQELRQTKAAHDEAFSAEYAIAKVNREAASELLQRRQRQLSDDTDAVVASAKAILALHDRMRAVLDRIEREGDPSAAANLRERRHELDKAAEVAKAVVPVETSEPSLPPVEPKRPTGPRVLTEPEVQERNRMLAAQAEREKTELPPLLQQVDKQKKALADTSRRITQRTLPASALAPAVKRFQEAEREYLARLELIEQNRRRIKKMFPVPGDPEFFPIGNGDLFTREEYEQARAMVEQHGSPQKAADAYIGKLLQDRLIEKASFVKVTDCRHPRAINPDGTPAPVRYLGGEKPRDACRKVWYRVRYTGAGGQVLERDGYATVFVEVGSWHLLPSPGYVLPGNQVIGVNLTFPDEGGLGHRRVAKT